MIEYQEIPYLDYIYLEDKTGAYMLIDDQYLIYLINDEHHREDGAAIINMDSNSKQYWLNGRYYGNTNINSPNYIPSDEYWIRYQKLKAFT